MIPFISQLPPDVQTALMVALLIVAFVVAFKIMKMVMQTILVSVLSAGFYLALVYTMGVQFSFNTMLFYAFLGSSLYMFYSFMASAYSIVAKLLEVPYYLLKLLFRPFKNLFLNLKEKHDINNFKQDLKRRTRSTKNDSGGEEQEGRETKEVVLDKVKKSDEKED